MILPLTSDIVNSKEQANFHFSVVYDLITIGDVTIDLYFKSESLTENKGRFHLAIGGKYVVDHFYESLGGGGANVAVGAAQLGLNVAVLGKVGENVFKQIIIQKLIQKNVSTEFLLSDRTYANISSILLSKSGDRTIIHHVTPNETLALSEIIRQNLVKTKMIYMGNLPNISIEERESILSFLKKKGVTTCLNLGVSDCRKPFSQATKLINWADIFILNTYEFAELVKRKRESINFNKDIREKINFKDKLLILTDGKNGSYIYSNDEVYHQKATRVEKIIDATGAGDAFTSGFLVEYLRSGGAKQAVRLGSDYAAKILQKIGAN